MAGEKDIFAKQETVKQTQDPWDFTSDVLNHPAPQKKLTKHTSNNQGVDIFGDDLMMLSNINTTQSYNKQPTASSAHTPSMNISQYSSSNPQQPIDFNFNQFSTNTTSGFDNQSGDLLDLTSFNTMPSSQPTQQPAVRKQTASVTKGHSIASNFNFDFGNMGSNPTQAPAPKTIQKSNTSGQTKTSKPSFDDPFADLLA